MKKIDFDCLTSLIYSNIYQQVNCAKNYVDHIRHEREVHTLFVTGSQNSNLITPPDIGLYNITEATFFFLEINSLSESEIRVKFNPELRG